VRGILHRVRCGALLGEVDDRVGAILLEQVTQGGVVLGDIDTVEGDLVAAYLVPGGQTCAKR
jgi:hypothetical protein